MPVAQNEYLTVGRLRARMPDPTEMRRTRAPSDERALQPCANRLDALRLQSPCNRLHSHAQGFHQGP